MKDRTLGLYNWDVPATTPFAAAFGVGLVTLLEVYSDNHRLRERLDEHQARVAALHKAGTILRTTRSMHACETAMRGSIPHICERAFGEWVLGNTMLSECRVPDEAMDALRAPEWPTSFERIDKACR